MADSAQSKKISRSQGTPRENATDGATWRQSIVAASLTFIASRLLLFAVWACVACIQPDAGATHTVGAPFITLQGDVIAKDLERMATYQDAGAYGAIAQGGYEVRPFETTRPANWASFPLHPMIWRALMALIGTSPLWGIVLANLYFLLGLVMLHRLCFALGYDAETAENSLRVLAFFPTSYFFSLPWSESLFLLVTTAACYALLRKHWLLAAIFGIAMCACRLAGLFLVVAFAVWAWQNRKTISRGAWIAIAVMPLGLFAFMGLLYQDTGDALAFVHVQNLWGRHFELPIKALGIVIAKPWVLASDGNFRVWNFAVFWIAIGATYWFAFRRNQKWLALFLLLGIVVPTLTGSIASLSRYGMALFPLAIAIGYAMRTRSIERMVLTLFVAMFVLFAVAFQAGLSFVSV